MVQTCHVPLLMLHLCLSRLFLMPTGPKRLSPRVVNLPPGKPESALDFLIREGDISVVSRTTLFFSAG